MRKKKKILSLTRFESGGIFATNEEQNVSCLGQKRNNHFFSKLKTLLLKPLRWSGVFFVLTLPSTAYAHNGAESDRYNFWFMLVVVVWSIIISTFSMWVVYSLLKERKRKNHTTNYLFENEGESNSEQIEEVKRRFYNEKQGTTIDVIMPQRKE